MRREVVHVPGAFRLAPPWDQAFEHQAGGGHVVLVTLIPSSPWKGSKRRGLQSFGLVPWRAKRSIAAFHGTRALDTSGPLFGIWISFDRTPFVHGPTPRPDSWRILKRVQQARSLGRRPHFQIEPVELVFETFDARPNRRLPLSPRARHRFVSILDPKFGRCDQERAHRRNPRVQQPPAAIKSVRERPRKQARAAAGSARSPSGRH
jgi:hypothetical protein